MFGRIECVERADGTGRRVRRIASGNGWLMTRFIARLRLRRERCAPEALAGCQGVPALAAEAPQRRDELWCAYLDGEPPQAASRLPRDFFDRLRKLVLCLHARGVCHNDLHKEDNTLVGVDRRPYLVASSSPACTGVAGASSRVGAPLTCATSKSTAAATTARDARRRRRWPALRHGCCAGSTSRSTTS